MSDSVGSVDIAVSGLRAEALRMNVLARNIANASTTRTADGTPYRRQDVMFSTAEGEDLGGVQIDGVELDMSDFKKIYQPGHPDADKAGFVRMPNVELPTEMMQMVAASRSYQANAAVLKRYQEQMDVTLELLK